LNEKIKILLVDDDPDITNVLSLVLHDIGYEPISASNGELAWQLLQSDHGIQAIVSDVQMPVLNGYMLCQRVRDDAQLQHLPFVFLSALTSLEERLKGFGVGGDDYIDKPISMAVAVVKIQHIIDTKLQKNNLSQQLKDSTQVAFQAMTYTSHLGNILQFLQSALQAADYQQLAENAFNVTTSLGLKCNLQFHTPNGILDFGSSGPVSPLESNVVELSRSKSRFFDFDRRTIINHDAFSLLVKNMPTDQPDQYGLLKDLLANLCHAIDAAAKLLNSHSKLQSKDQLINAVNNAINEVNRTFGAVQNDSSRAISHMSAELEEAMLTQLGLSESQEDTIRSIVNEMQQHTTKNFDLISKLQDKLENIRSSMQNATQ